MGSVNNRKNDGTVEVTCTDSKFGSLFTELRPSHYDRGYLVELAVYDTDTDVLSITVDSDADYAISVDVSTDEAEALILMLQMGLKRLRENEEKK